MRIKDLATRATKLLTGNAWFVVDNGTKVEKVDYAELAKQIITEYNTQTLAGSAQSVKSALDALNSKNYTDQTSGNSLLDFVATLDKGTYNFRLDNAPEAPVTGGITYTVIKTHTVGDTRCSIIATTMYSSYPDIYSAFVGQNATSITWKKAAKQSDVDVLNGNLTNTLKSGANNIDNLIVGGYSTGSGNYFDLFVPLSTSGKDVTAASVSSSTIVFLPAQRVGFSSAPTITVLATTKYGVRLELAFPSTQAANVPGTVYLIGLTLTCS